MRVLRTCLPAGRRIIRDGGEHDRISQYIAENPANWKGAPRPMSRCSAGDDLISIFGTAVPEVMTFDTKGNQSQAVDQILARVSKLSAADRRAFMKAIRQQERKNDIAWLHKVWGKVTLKDSEITRLVEEVRTEMHAARSPKTRR